MASRLLHAIGRLGHALAFLLLIGCSPDYDAMERVTVTVDIDGGHGSGVVVGPRTILTAGHVAQDGKIEVVFSNGATMPATVVWKGLGTFDVAILRLEDDAPVSPARISCQAVSIGQDITAMGQPGAGHWVATYGKVASNREYGNAKGAVLIDMTVMPGVSGGPVFNSSGQVVGIMHALLITPIGMFPSVSGLGLMIPTSEICAATQFGSAA